jgi:hypothetical protein
MSHFVRSDGHLTDAALSALVDSEDGVLDESAESHLNECELCLGRVGTLTETLTRLDGDLGRAPLARPTLPWRLIAAGGLVGAVGVALSFGDRASLPSLHTLGSSLAWLRHVHGVTTQPWLVGGCVAMTVICAAIAHKFSTNMRTQ